MADPATFPLNADVTDCILLTLLDFQSLVAFISTSKFVYIVFRSRRNSILDAITRNHFGPVLPLAMRLVWLNDGTYPSEWVISAHLEAVVYDRMVNPAQVRLLRDHAAVIQALEHIYSWREKDPRYRTSRLSAAESHKFQRAVYRFWLLAAAYGPATLADSGLGLSTSEHLQFKNSTIMKQMSFFSSLKKSELLGVDEVHRFLLGLAEWAWHKFLGASTPLASLTLRLHMMTHHHVVWRGPAVILDILGGKCLSLNPIESQWHDVWQAMTHAFSTIEVVPFATWGRTSRPRHILDNNFFETLECSQCRFKPTTNVDSLWNTCNWEGLEPYIPPMSLWESPAFPGERPLKELVSFKEAIDSVSFPQLIDEIFDVRSAQYEDWKKDDWLCTRCMRQLLSGNVHGWFCQKRNSLQI